MKRVVATIVFWLWIVVLIITAPILIPIDLLCRLPDSFDWAIKTLGLKGWEK